MYNLQTTNKLQDGGTDLESDCIHYNTSKTLYQDPLRFFKGI